MPKSNDYNKGFHKLKKTNENQRLKTELEEAQKDLKEAEEDLEEAEKELKGLTEFELPY